MSLRPAVSCPLQAGRRLGTGSLSHVLQRQQPWRADSPLPVSRARSPCPRCWAHSRTTTKTVTVTETITTETVTTTTTTVTTTNPPTTTPLASSAAPLPATPPTTPTPSHDHTSRLADHGLPAPQGLGSQAQQGDPLGFRHLVPQAYNPGTESWAASAAAVNVPPLQPRAVVKLVSWNLDRSAADPAVRARTAMSYLGRTFGDDPGHLVIMLQSLHPSSLQAVLDHDWVRRNFILSDASPPRWYHAATLARTSEGGTLPRVLRLMLVSRTLPIANCFRVTFKSRFHSDAVITDLSLAPQAGSRGSKDGEAAIRLCTTSLDLAGRPDDVPARKLALIASILEGSWPPPSATSTREVLAGVVGGNFDTHHRGQAADERLVDWVASQFGLKDAYTRNTAGSFRRQRPADAEKEDSRDTAPPPDPDPDSDLDPYLRDRRVERFLYTGPLGIVPLPEAQLVDDPSGVGHLGIGLETDEEVEAWWYWLPAIGRRQYVSEDTAERRRRWVAETQKDRPLRVSREWTRVPVSRFPAIAVGVRMPW